MRQNERYHSNHPLLFCIYFSSGGEIVGAFYKPMKAACAKQAKRLQDIPNIGPHMASDLRRLGMRTPFDLKGKDAITLYKKISKLSGTRHDPCVLDVYMAAIDFMNGAPPRPWYAYTEKRKRKFPGI